MLRNSFTIQLPGWIGDFLDSRPDILPGMEDRMKMVIDLARRNIEENTGGPFAAAVFEIGTGRLISTGVNVVIAGKCSLAHAEMAALALAQASLGTHDLSSAGSTQYELVTSTEPCAMCLGAIPWSGVTRVVCGAREEDARRIGFNEGDKPADWPQLFQKRGIEVFRDVLRQQAGEVLQEYSRRGGMIY
jgi:tRNA(Arg) A34 adenosine deaminase TadA